MTSKNQLDLYAQQAWTNTLQNILEKQFGHQQGLKLYKEYEPLFEYFMQSSAERAVFDIIGLERCKTQKLSTHFEPGNNTHTRLNIYALDEHVELSSSLEILKSMGLKVLLEKPKEVVLNEQIFWIHRYQVNLANCTQIIVDDKTNHYFEQLYLHCWHGHYPIDTFNLLLLGAHLNAREIQIFRAYAAYLKQIKTPYSPEYIAQALIANPQICQLLTQQFEYRFNPGKTITKPLDKQFETLLNDVTSLDHDTILKTCSELIAATCRTNFYQNDIHQNKQILSFKLIPSDIKIIPKPTPAFEIFVYSKRFEGVHLRGGKVARGGLRWSNRPEDYRTEILGLMKAQMVKNSVIVPTGSKGGFICKALNAQHSRSEQMHEVEQCYRLYIFSLLQLTDNLVNGAIEHPQNMRIHDDNDPYLVVAADKGTATFSDIANDIAQQNNFWLGDAFASGGSVGYDHKKMGITARGAWESVKRHFRMLNINCQQQSFSVIGIGDMSGDVFGNGMLLSTKIKLIAAFNHLHIFIDPDPDPKTSYAERQRLFNLPRSSWDDYDKKLISEGGGVFSRNSKKVILSEPIQRCLGIHQSVLTPDELIHNLLKAKADLLWNGGIGTYIKASNESHLEVQDKANDAIRINANELNVKIIGEGGNLGVTQLGRIEFARSGGDIYTDAIDNSAGVDCSDHEVNIKILLQQVIQDGLIDTSERNQLLESMTDEVAELTLTHNKKQTQIIDMLAQNAHENAFEHARYITHLEHNKILSRRLEQLPSDNALKERINNGMGLTKPELAVLVSYSKIVFQHALIEADCFDNRVFEAILFDYFPKPLRQRFAPQIKNHALKNNIMATRVANQMVDHLGIGFGFKMKEETSANITQIAKAYISVIKIFNLKQLWQDIENIDNIPEPVRYQCLQTITGLMQRSISWILRHYPNQFDVEFIVKRFQPPVQKLQQKIYSLLSGDTKKETSDYKKALKKHQFPEDIYTRLPAVIPLSSSFDIAETALALKAPIDKTAKLFYSVAKRLDLQWLKQCLAKINIGNHWHQLAIAAMRNELHLYQKDITYYLHKSIKNKNHIHRALEQWEEQHFYALNRYDQQLSTIKKHRVLDYPLLIVAINEVRLISKQLASEHIPRQ